MGGQLSTGYDHRGRNRQPGASGSQTTQITEPAAATAYANVSGSLFGASGPSYSDVQQGGVGDCWLLASLAEVAARDPADITSMFTAAGTAVENGVTVSLYNVRFYNSQGVAKYVTVDTRLPSAGGYYDQVSNGPLWVALAEKAYAEANAAGDVTTQYAGSDSYAALNGGDPAWALSAITGKPASDFNINTSNLAAAWNAGDLIVLGLEFLGERQPCRGRFPRDPRLRRRRLQRVEQHAFRAVQSLGRKLHGRRDHFFQWASGLRRGILCQRGPGPAGFFRPVPGQRIIRRGRRRPASGG